MIWGTIRPNVLISSPSGFDSPIEFRFGVRFTFLQILSLIHECLAPVSTKNVTCFSFILHMPCIGVWNELMLLTCVLNLSGHSLLTCPDFLQL